MNNENSPKSNIRSIQDKTLLDSGFNPNQVSRVRGYVMSVTPRDRSGRFRTDVLFDWMSKNANSILGWTSKAYTKALIRTIRESTPENYRDHAEGMGINMAAISHENALYVIEAVSRVYFTHAEDALNEAKLAQTRKDTKERLDKLQKEAQSKREKSKETRERRMTVERLLRKKTAEFNRVVLEKAQLEAELTTLLDASNDKKPGSTGSRPRKRNRRPKKAAPGTTTIGEIAPALETVCVK